MKNKSIQPNLNSTKNLSSEALGKLVQEFMQKKKIIKFKTKGKSMKPAINDDDLIAISPYCNTSPCPGDIAAYIHPLTNRLTIHRLIKIDEDTFIAKGDNCRRSDPALHTKCISGYVSMINDGNSIYNLFLSSPLKKLLAILSNLGLLFIFNRILKKIKA